MYTIFTWITGLKGRKWLGGNFCRLWRYLKKKPFLKPNCWSKLLSFLISLKYHSCKAVVKRKQVGMNNSNDQNDAKARWQWHLQVTSLLALAARQEENAEQQDSSRGRRRRLSPALFPFPQFSSLRPAGIRTAEKAWNWLRHWTYRRIFLNTWKSMQFVQDLILGRGK